MTEGPTVVVYVLMSAALTVTLVVMFFVRW